MWVKITPRKPRDKDHYETVSVINEKQFTAYQKYRSVVSMGLRDHNRVRQVLAALKRVLQCNVQLYEFVIIERNNQWHLCIQPNDVWPGKADYYAGILRVVGRRWSPSPKPRGIRASRGGGETEARYLMAE